MAANFAYSSRVLLTRVAPGAAPVEVERLIDHTTAHLRELAPQVAPFGAVDIPAQRRSSRTQRAR